MANPGGVGTKFVSVNLNKSYGPISHHPQPYGSSSYGQAAAGRGRLGSNGSGGGGGGGMVVLSRPRNLQKAGPKLSVPPPLNLPSLRKEHEKFDSSGSGGGSAGGGGLGSGSRPTSSGVGWTKPGSVAMPEKDGNAAAAVFGRSGGNSQAVDSMDQGVQSVDAATKGSTAYMPPSARLGGVGIPAFVSAEKTSVLRGEDFPSLKAALPSSVSGPGQKQKDSSMHQKQKQVLGAGSSKEQMDSSPLSSLVHMCPQEQHLHHTFGNGSNQNGSSQRVEQARKQEYFPSPLPLVRLNPRSDWADDERDTGYGFVDRGRDHGYSKSVAFWDDEFDMPRKSVLPHKPAHNLVERWGKRQDETAKVSANEIPKVDPYRRDVRTPSREDNLRNSPLPKDGVNKQVGNDGNGIGARPVGLNREMGKEDKYTPPNFGGNSHDGVTGNLESPFGRRDMGRGQEERNQWNHTVESSISRGTEWNARERYGSEQSNRYSGSSLQYRSASKTMFSSGSKGLPMNDPILNFGREKRVFTKSERLYLDAPSLKDYGTSFDDPDPFSGGLVGVIKRKKDVVQQADFHDPVRESFEAELERVQKMQEQERQRIIEEQERALQQAQREEEERQRLIREEEERQRRLEEEAREAFWRAEQERLDAIRQAEEQKIAKEEEKHRIVMEEERRKQAAKQKLLELEAKIAQRQAEAAKSESCAAIPDEKMSAMVMEKDVDTWEGSERMVERTITSGSSDSSGQNRPFELAPGIQSSREGSSGFLDRGKPANSWRSDVFENGKSSSFLIQDQDNGHHSPRPGVSVGGRPFTRKEFYGGTGYMSSRAYFRGGMQEPYMEDVTHLKGHRWNASGDGDPYSRNTEIDSEFHENLAEKYSDVGWGQGRAQGNPHSPYQERLYSEADELYPYGRSRYSMRQPRVLPPPSLVSMHTTSFKTENECPNPSNFSDNNMHYNHSPRSESIVQAGFYGGQLEKFVASETVDVQPQRTMIPEQKLDEDTTPRCDSRSSLSGSSPPNSPSHLSHDDFDESGDSPVVSAATEGKEISLSGNESIFLNANSGKDNVVTASSLISAADDEDWSLENNEELQEQEEYDEDEDGYQEEDEVHEGDDDENIELTQDFEDLHLQEKGSSHMMDNLVLGFNEGVEVGIPNDDFERSSRNEDGIFGIPEVSVGVIEEQGETQGDAQCLQLLDSSPRTFIDSSSKRIQETEKAIQDSVAQPVNMASHTLPTSDFLDNVDRSSSSGIPIQHTVPSSVNMASHSSSGQTVMSNVPIGSTQADSPVKLQFGLFSGPSLIPSPVPAIQIGSIQMPLHLHPPVGPSLAHIHSSQPPLFQFGQLRYTSAISQGILPIASQSVPFVQPNVQPHYYLNQSSGGPLPIQPGHDDSTENLIKDDVPSVSVDGRSTETNAPMQKSQAEISHAGVNNFMPEQVSEGGDEGFHKKVVKNYKLSSNGTISGGQLQTGPTSSQHVSSDKGSRGSKAQAPQYGTKGKRFAYSARNSGFRPSFPASEVSLSDSRGFQRRPPRTIQRTEFRVRNNVDRRQSPGLVSSNNLEQDDKPNFTATDVGIFGKSGSKKGLMANKPLKQIVEPEPLISVPIGSQGTDSETKLDKKIEKEASSKTHSIAHSGEGNLKRTIGSEEDVDAPLQSGMVRVYNQPGIEAPSDEDDFIEVRSKRQMLNDRREQREKEIKAKSQVTKAPPKPRSITAQNAVVSTSPNKISVSLRGKAQINIRSDVVYEGRGLVNVEASTGFATMMSQTLAPIGTPVITDAQANRRPHNVKSLQTGSTSVASNGRKNLGPGPVFEAKNKILNNVQTSLGSWSNARINQQVMALTQTQFDEAMKPGRLETHVASIGDHTSSITEPIMPSSSILTKDKSFSSVASPINSLLAGEKIQFGAVTSPTVLPSSSRAVSHGIGAPGSCRSDIQISHSLSAAENDCNLFFEKDKNHNDTSVNLEDCEAEAEAEAAASAIAVAAISSDEIVGNGLETSSVSVSDAKNFRGVAGNQQLASQSRAEESLSVALPADLSVETPSISLWPPLPSPQNSSSQMFSHFPGGPSSHFPFYEMNPMLGGPIFAFGPHDESSATQSQSQTSTVSGSGSVGTWQQCHSGMDSFYGPPAGFTGPYFSPPGGIPGVQGPPHMVVYNHFPVGQFGQVGLSFMGTTYIPSGKQPDWKHNPTSSALGIGEGDMNDRDVVSAQRNPSNMAAPVQHLAPGSQLLPVASPLAMFDVSPFQSAPDMSVQGRWSHVPTSALHSVPLSMPLQQQEAGVLPSHFSHGHPIDPSSLAAHRFSESRTSTPSDSNRSFPMVTDATATRFPNELGLVNSSSSTGVGASTQSAVAKSSSGGTIADAGMTDAGKIGSSNNSNGQSTIAFKAQSSQQKNISAQQSSQSTSYNYQRGGLSQKNNSGGDWLPRRMGFHGRNQSLGTEKSYSSSKVKQIYVAKQTPGGTSTVG